MCKVLFALLIVLCVLGGWNYFQSANEIERLRNSLRARGDEVAKHCAEIEDLRKENGRLQKEIDKFDKWIKTRGNFELNKVQLKIKFDEIIKNFREAENLWAHIDETPGSTPMDRMNVVPSNPRGVNSRTNNISERASTPLPRLNENKGSGSVVAPSGRKQTKSDDKEKEKGWFENVKKFLE